MWEWKEVAPIEFIGPPRWFTWLCGNRVAIAIGLCVGTALHRITGRPVCVFYWSDKRGFSLIRFP